MSKGDMTKWDYFFALDVREFLNLMSYMKARNANVKQPASGVSI